MLRNRGPASTGTLARHAPESGAGMDRNPQITKSSCSDNTGVQDNKAFVMFPSSGIAILRREGTLPSTSQSLLLACAVQRRRFPVGANPTRQRLQPEATGAAMEETKWLKPSGKRVTKYGDSASVQAVTRVNAEQASKRTMRRPTRQPYRGRLTRLGGLSEAAPPDAAPG